MLESWPPEQVSLTPGKRVLFLTKDLDLIRKQLYDGLNLRMEDLEVDDLLDDINTDVMTPAWVCFDHDPAVIAENAYAGLIHEGRRVFEPRALLDGGFEVIVSGHRKGTGSSRETAAQCERWSGVRVVIAASFAPIHERNNINLGQLMGDHEMLRRLQDGERLSLDKFVSEYDPVTRLIVENGGILPFAQKLKDGEVELPVLDTSPRPMNMIEKMISSKLLGGNGAASYVKPGDAVLAQVDGGYSHEFTTAQVHEFLKQEYGDLYTLPNPSKFAVFEDHLLYATGVPRFGRFTDKIQTLRDMQGVFQQHTGVRDYSAKDGISPGICHQVAREEFIDVGDFIQATDSHTCMGGATNALAYGVGATEYANLVHNQFAFVQVPESIRFELFGTLDPGCTAKDVILHILWKYAKESETLDRSMEFGGPGLASLSMDERATLCNMATECSAKTGICEADNLTVEWLLERRSGIDEDAVRRAFVLPDEGAEYDGGVHMIDLREIRPMVAHPGEPDKGIPSDPTNGAYIDSIGDVQIDIAYAGSCTAGKDDDFAYYAKVTEAALEAGMTIPSDVACYIQFGSKSVKELSEREGWSDIFRQAGIKLIDPGCGACIGAGPGISEDEDQVTVSAINRNYQGRSGPGRLYLASPLTVMASAFMGRITAWHPDLFAQS
ncbi:MAG: aconitase family protein [Candidatus Thermoplasmatota archaeon]|nr:aconitase family protein [Candidatus Thermoplasmatota archaeon]MEE3270378.1 aconitase family protein [Candidatus Thermoplasmatota archaeon]